MSLFISSQITTMWNSSLEVIKHVHTHLNKLSERDPMHVLDHHVLCNTCLCNIVKQLILINLYKYNLCAPAPSHAAMDTNKMLSHFGPLILPTLTMALSILDLASHSYTRLPVNRSQQMEQQKTGSHQYRILVIQR